MAELTLIALTFVFFHVLVMQVFGYVLQVPTIDFVTS